MNKKNEKKIVKIAEKEVYEFVKEWKENPYLWDSEADVHGELYVRIKKAIKDGGFPSVIWRYKKYMSKKAQFDLVYCKPLTYVEGEGRYYPDIVIYERSTFSDDDKERNEPMLWVCEIKYQTQWGGDQSEENRKYDEKKLRQLLLQSKNPKICGTEYAYLVDLKRTSKEAIAICKRITIKKGCKQGKRDGSNQRLF